MKTAEEILIEAAELVERDRGWCQGQNHRLMWDVDGLHEQHCLVGAIRTAAGIAVMREGDGIAEYVDFGTSFQGLREATRAVGLELGVGDPLAIMAWNDMRGRTPEEVATTLRNAKRHLDATVTA